MPQEPFSRPQPQYWIKILDPWMQYFYPVLGWVWHPYREIHNSSQHPYWIKIDFPITIGAKMITCRKNCFEQLIFELHRITVHLLSFARINFRL